MARFKYELLNFNIYDRCLNFVIFFFYELTVDFDADIGHLLEVLVLSEKWKLVVYKNVSAEAIRQR